MHFTELWLAYIFPFAEWKLNYGNFSRVAMVRRFFSVMEIHIKNSSLYN